MKSTRNKCIFIHQLIQDSDLIRGVYIYILYIYIYIYIYIYTQCPSPLLLPISLAHLIAHHPYYYPSQCPFHCSSSLSLPLPLLIYTSSYLLLLLPISLLICSQSKHWVNIFSYPKFDICSSLILSERVHAAMSLSS